MDFVSVDIETTGLNPDTDQVLSIGAVWCPDSMRETPVENLPTFHVCVKHDYYHGNAIALAMNAELLKRCDKSGFTPGAAADQFYDWLNQFLRATGQKLNVAGKNFAGFDRQFLKRFDSRFEQCWRHRVIDPAILYRRDGDTELPNTEACTQRMCEKLCLAGYSYNKHDAVDDARNVVRLIRFHLGGRVL